MKDQLKKEFDKYDVYLLSWKKTPRMNISGRTTSEVWTEGQFIEYREKSSMHEVQP